MDSLTKQLERYPWFISVGIPEGINQDCVFVYVTEKPSDTSPIPEVWEGLPTQLVVLHHRP